MKTKDGLKIIPALVLVIVAGILFFLINSKTIPQIRPGNYPDILGETNKELLQAKAKEEEENDQNVTASDLFLVSRVVDGDTIELASGEIVRYIGIDTPELSSQNLEIRLLAGQALAKNKELVEGRKVFLEKDISERDKYGRLLRYVFLEEGVFVNLELVREGFAYSSAYPPDIAYQLQFEAAEQEAREEGKGLWH